MTALDDALASAAAGHTPDTIALMRILAEAETEGTAREALSAACAASEGAEADRLARLRDLWDAHPQAWTVVRRTIGGITHRPPAGDAAATLGYWAAAFDRLVAGAPEASVALYSLGSPALLAAATDEIVGRMADWELLSPDHNVLDLGCGIGRFVTALAPRVRHVTGIDISAGMVAEAQRRCASLQNVTLWQGDGQHLAGVPDQSLDLVLAVDVYPYLVEAGEAVVAQQIAESARVLRPGGALLALNYSYRGDHALDRHDMRRRAGRRFVVERDGTMDFSLWDGATFLLRRTSQA